MSYEPKSLFPKKEDEGRSSQSIAVSGVYIPKSLFEITTGKMLDSSIATTGEIKIDPSGFKIVTGEMASTKYSGPYVVMKAKPLFNVNDSYNKINPLFTPAHIAKQVDPKDITPKVMFTNSKIRNRINITIEDLNKYSVDLKVKEIALNQILQTNVDDLSLEYVLNWGSTVQQTHKKILDTLLGSAIENEAKDAKNLILKIITLINSVDFASVNKKSLFASKDSKKHKIREALDQISHTSDDLLLRIGKLKAVWDNIRKVTKQLNDLQFELEPFIVSCDFFSTYAKDNFPTDLFLSRLTSLMSTKLMLVQNHQQQKLIESSVYNLIDTIQGTITTEIPMWQNNYINTLTIDDSSGMVALDQQRTAISQKLKDIL